MSQAQSKGPDLPVAVSCPRAKVVAVTVTYFPEVSVALDNLGAIGLQTEATVVVDNGSPEALCDALAAGYGPGLSLLRLGRNLGIARAQNLGVQRARDLGATHIVLFDQDSRPDPGTVARLLAAADALTAAGVAVGLVAPAFYDRRQARPVPFFRAAGGRLRWTVCAERDGLLEIDTAIASGALIPMAALAAVGGMREELFIDLVDIDWCFRARALGLRNFCVCDALMEHRLGDAPLNLLGRAVPLHSPLRNYYYFRNAVWLFKQRYVPAVWKRDVARQLLKRLLVYPIGVAPRLGYLSNMLRGIADGLRNRLGRRD